jgi:YHS domain-containing protein
MLRAALAILAIPLLAVLPGSLLGAAAAEPALKALRIEQITSGIPGHRPDEPTRSQRQVLLVDEKGERILLEAYDLSSGRLEERTILRLDETPPVIRVVAPDGSSYREHRGDLNDFQKNRRIRELEQLRIVKTLPRRERDAYLAQNHWRLDGKREVTLEHGETRRLLDHDCRRVVITENGRRIVDGWIAEAAGGGRSYFNLYRRLGAFSDEVLEKLQAVRGIPLRASITVVTELPTYELEVEVQKIEEVAVPPATFQTPPGAKKIEEAPRETRCALPSCGKTVDPKSAGGQGRIDGKVVYYCSEEHSTEHFEEIRKAKKR